MDSPTRLPLLVSTHSPTFYYYSLTSIFCIAGKQCTCYCCLYYEDVLDAFLPILCRTSPWDQFQKNQGNEIVVYYLLFTGLLGYQPSHCYQPIFLELLLQSLLLLVTVLLLLLYYDRRHLSDYRHWLFICIYCISKILAACIVLCVFAGYQIKGYHYLIAQSSNFISFEKFFFPGPQIQLQL